MSKELWLEFGYLEGKSQDMCWYNEGNWQELPYFLKKLWQWRHRKGIYFFWRYGKTPHYLIKRQSHE